MGWIRMSSRRPGDVRSTMGASKSIILTCDVPFTFRTIPIRVSENQKGSEPTFRPSWKALLSLNETYESCVETTLVGTSYTLAVKSAPSALGATLPRRGVVTRSCKPVTQSYTINTKQSIFTWAVNGRLHSTSAKMNKRIHFILSPQVGKMTSIGGKIANAYIHHFIICLFDFVVF